MIIRVLPLWADLILIDLTSSDLSRLRFTGHVVMPEIGEEKVVTVSAL